MMQEPTPDYEYEAKPLRGGKLQQVRLKMVTNDTKIEITVRAETRMAAQALLCQRLEQMMGVCNGW